MPLKRVEYVYSALGDPSIHQRFALGVGLDCNIWYPPPVETVPPIEFGPGGFPIIAPTGVMSTNAYIEYMIEYNGYLADYIINNLNGDFYSRRTINDWNNLWVRTLDDVSDMIDDMNTKISEMQAQITMIQNSL